MSSHEPSEREYHPVSNRVLYVGNIPMDTTVGDLTAMFDICLGKNSLAFVQYPYDSDAKCHKGFAFVMLNRNSDVGACLAKRYRSWFYVEGKPSQGGFNADGRAYVRVRPAHVEESNPKREVSTHLIFTPREEGVGLRDFKLQVEDLVASLGVSILKSEGQLDGKNKYVHLHFHDGESAAAVKMFAHQFKENDVTMLVRNARKPKVVAPTTVVETAKMESAPEKSFVIEAITENYGRFGIPYAQAVKNGSALPAPVAVKVPEKAMQKPQTATKVKRGAVSTSKRSSTAGTA